MRSAALEVLGKMEAERAHRLALLALRLGLAGRPRLPPDPVLRVSVLGRDFRNPIGLAAGFDKDALAVRGLANVGFGFIETGTVTPRPQPGNRPPRLFRLRDDGAVINRMGFNNRGLDAYLARLARHPRRTVPVGANLGINKDGADPERDYPAMIEAIGRLVDYVVINVSSPNTPGLRDLQAAERLGGVLGAINGRGTVRPPLLVKIAPDLSSEALEALIEVCVAQGVAGLIVSNTTISRPPTLRSPDRDEAGGLSGRPLFALSTAMLARTHLLARGRLTLIGVGGVASGEEALTKIRAGASLVQLYTAFAYLGPALIPRICAELATALRSAGFSRVEDAVGTDAARWAALWSPGRDTGERVHA